MRRWIAASMGALVLAAVCRFVIRKPAGGGEDGQRNGRGGQSRIRSPSRTKDAEMKLIVDTKTKVIGTGVGTKDGEDEGREEVAADCRLREGRRLVSAKYDDATKHATEVRLVKAAAK